MTRRIILVASILLPLLLLIILDTGEHYEEGVTELRENKLRTAIKEKLAQAAREKAAREQGQLVPTATLSASEPGKSSAR